ncbi:hypothetical protein DEO72_LG8g2525 [Vigna unguiculata]|uniref:Uncharacterized protein n=1 Tax=Vigna unguiculata TaxID=3917 RepID=A0A4D6MWJ2_VIGUN|nr:hypothetical protein DEO72_LG8g2525 [Vigna unguiculata]
MGNSFPLGYLFRHSRLLRSSYRCDALPFYHIGGPWDVLGPTIDGLLVEVFPLKLVSSLPSCLFVCCHKPTFLLPLSIHNPHFSIFFNFSPGDLERRTTNCLRCSVHMKAFEKHPSSHPPPIIVEASVRIAEATLIPSDEEETLSKTGLKRQRKGYVVRIESEFAATSSHTPLEHALSSMGVMPLEGLSNAFQSFWDSSFRHAAHSMAHNVFEGDLQYLLNQDVLSIREDICAFLHKVEVSSMSLCEKLDRLSLVEGKKDKEMVDLKLEVSLPDYQACGNGKAKEKP